MSTDTLSIQLLERIVVSLFVILSGATAMISEAQAQVVATAPVTVADSGLCLEAQSGSMAPGKALVQGFCTSEFQQDWRFESNTSDTAGLFENAASGWCVEVMPDASVQQQPCHGGDTQQFKPFPQPAGGVSLVSVSTGHCLHVADDKMGTPVFASPCDGSNDQRFHDVRPQLADAGFFGTRHDLDTYRITYNDGGSVEMLTFATPGPTTPTVLDTTDPIVQTSVDTNGGTLEIAFPKGRRLVKLSERWVENASLMLEPSFSAAFAFSNLPTPIDGVTLLENNRGFSVSGSTIHELGTSNTVPGTAVSGSLSTFGFVDRAIAPETFAVITPGTSATPLGTTRIINNYRFTIDQIAVAQALPETGLPTGSTFALGTYTTAPATDTSDPLFGTRRFELFYRNDNVPWTKLMGPHDWLAGQGWELDVALVVGPCELLIAVDEVNGNILAQTFSFVDCNHPEQGLASYSASGWPVLHNASIVRGLDATFQHDAPVLEPDVNWVITTGPAVGPHTTVTRRFEDLTLDPLSWQDARSYRFTVSLEGAGFGFDVQEWTLEGVFSYECTDGTQVQTHTRSRTQWKMLSGRQFVSDPLNQTHFIDCVQFGPEFHFVPDSGLYTVTGEIFAMGQASPWRTFTLEQRFGEVLPGRDFDMYAITTAPPSLPGGTPLVFVSPLDVSGPSAALQNGIATETIPFAFEYLGVPVSTVKVSTNGLVMFDQTSNLTFPNNGRLPSSLDPNGTIAWWWDDLELTPSSSATVTTVGSPGRQRMVFTFTDWAQNSDPSSSLDAQVELHEGTNEIVVHYGMANGSFSATQGWEDVAGVRGADQSCSPTCDSADWPTEDRYRFVPMP
ncbi:MAG: RICIN domain-containing protein [Myxococcota bacterium]